MPPLKVWHIAKPKYLSWQALSDSIEQCLQAWSMDQQHQHDQHHLGVGVILTFEIHRSRVR